MNGARLEPDAVGPEVPRSFRNVCREGLGAGLVLVRRWCVLACRGDRMEG